MDELDGGRQLDRWCADSRVPAAQHRAGNGHHRAHALAAGGNQMPGELRDQRDLACHPVDDGGVDPGHIRGKHVDQRCE